MSDLLAFTFYSKLYRNNLYVPYELKVAYREYRKLLPPQTIIQYYYNNFDSNESTILWANNS